MITFQYFQRKLHNLTHPIQGEILMLHRVVEQRSAGENRELEITPKYLEQTIEKYRQQGYQFVSIDYITHHSPFTFHLSPKLVCLTFDDGYRDTYTIALPLLKRLGIPFAVYVTTGFVGNKQPMWWYPNENLCLSRDELKALDTEPLCTICAHTVSHPRLDTLTSENQRKEIADSKETLEQWLGHPVDHFSYPHGAYNDDTIAIVRDCGFRTALMAWGGTVRLGDNPFLLHRIELKQP